MIPENIDALHFVRLDLLHDHFPITSTTPSIYTWDRAVSLATKPIPPVGPHILTFPQLVQLIHELDDASSFSMGSSYDHSSLFLEDQLFIASSLVTILCPHISLDNIIPCEYISLSRIPLTDALLLQEHAFGFHQLVRRIWYDYLWKVQDDTSSLHLFNEGSLFITHDCFCKVTPPVSHRAFYNLATFIATIHANTLHPSIPLSNVLMIPTLCLDEVVISIIRTQCPY